MKRMIISLCVVLSLLASNEMKGQNELLPVTYGTGRLSITVLPETQRQSAPDRLTGLTDEMKQRFMPDGTYTNAVNVFLVEYAGKRVLIDAGYGRELFDHLKTCDIRPEDIDAILMTHMHGDHIGGLLKDGAKSFPNATLYISQPEHDYWMSDDAMQKAPESRRNGFGETRKVIAAYKQNLQTFTPGTIEDRSREVLPGIKSIAAYGHTPGHTAYLFEDSETRFLVWGDLTHAVDVQVAYPQVAYAADTDPAQSTESRRRIFGYLSRTEGIWVAGMHIEHPGMGEVKSNAAGYTFTLLCTCEGSFR